MPDPISPAAVTVPQGALKVLLRFAPTPIIVGSPGRFTAQGSPGLVGDFEPPAAVRLVSVVALARPMPGAAPGKWTAFVRLSDGTPLASGAFDASGRAALTLADTPVPAGSRVECGVTVQAGTPGLDAPSFTLAWVPADL